MNNANIQYCGFPEVGVDFRPHATLNWYRMRATGSTGSGDQRGVSVAEVAAVEVVEETVEVVADRGTELEGTEAVGELGAGARVLVVDVELAVDSEVAGIARSECIAVPPPAACLSGRYDTLAVCVLGPQGTCPQTLATFPLSG
jgi:hypothetical protein